MKLLLVLLGLTAATSSVTALCTGRVQVFVNPDPEVAMYRDVEPLDFWCITTFYALLALLAFYFAAY